jgi:hypothetical protein
MMAESAANSVREKAEGGHPTGAALQGRRPHACLHDRVSLSSKLRLLIAGVIGSYANSFWSNVIFLTERSDCPQ